MIRAKKIIALLSNKKVQKILDCIQNNNFCVNEIVEKTKYVQSEVSTLLSKLKIYDIVVTEKKGKHRCYSINQNQINYYNELILKF